MTKRCKVIAVLHSGEKGKRGTPTRAKRETQLLGKCVHFNMELSDVGNYFQLDVDELAFTDTFVSERPITARRYKIVNGKEYYEVETETIIYKLLVV